MKKVLHVITGLNDGGAEGVLARLCLNSELEHTVVSMMDEGKYGPILEKGGVKVYCLGMDRGKLSLRKWLKLIQIIKKEQPDCVQTWMYHADLFGGLAARFAGVPGVFWGVRMSSLEKGRSSAATRAIARLCAGISGWVPASIICCAEEAKKVHAEIGYSARKLKTIFNGYDVTRLSVDKERRNSVRNELGISENTFLLGMVGRYDPLKDHETLLRAIQLIAQELDDFRCVLIGTNIDENNPELLELIEKLDLEARVQLLGPRADIPDIMNALDLHVLSSRSEGFPNVVAEAMACGTPCISTDVGDARHIIGDAKAVCPAGRPEELANLILAMESECRNNTDKWASRKRFCRDRIVEHFSIESMVENFEHAWFGDLQRSESFS